MYEQSFYGFVDVPLVITVKMPSNDEMSESAIRGGKKSRAESALNAALDTRDIYVVELCVEVYYTQ